MMEKGMTATKHDTLVVDNAAIIDVKLNFHWMDIVVLPTEALMRRPQGTKLKFQLAHFKTESLSEPHSYVNTHTHHVCQGRHVDIQHFSIFKPDYCVPDQTQTQLVVYYLQIQNQ